MNNVYSDPEYADVVADMKQRLEKMRVKYKDSEELDKKYIKLYEEEEEEWEEEKAAIEELEEE